MHQVTKFCEGRSTAVIAIGALAILPFWMYLGPVPQTVSVPPLFDPNPLATQPPPTLPPPTPSPPFHSTSRLLPFQYWNHRTVYPERYTKISCMKLPSVSELQYAAYSWQLLPVQNGSIYIYGAYYDTRFNEQLVRILIYSDVKPLPKLLCQLWFLDDNEPQTELADPLYGWNPSWQGPLNGLNEPYVLTCRCRRHPPDDNVAPAAVAVVTAPCGVATNVLNVQGAPIYDELDLEDEESSSSEGTSVAVCLKWLHYQNDVSVELIEWLQLVKHFGAGQVFIDVVRVHPNTRKVLQYYEDEGFVDVTELSHPPQVSGFREKDYIRDQRDYRRELLPLNDCLYRSVGRYDWVTSLDLDEIIVPPSGSTWPDLIDNVTATAAAEPGGTPLDALLCPNYYVLDGAQKDLAAPAKTRILAHTWRTISPGAVTQVKSFFNVSSVTTMHNHSPISCKGVLNGCKKRYLDKGPGRIFHFRETCLNNQLDCKELHDVVKEDVFDKVRAPVLAEVREILEKLGLGGLE